MRKSNKDAAQTRQAIVATAADHIRRTGLAETSLADVMAAAGLTHGGFYKHFRNKEQLVAEALAAAGEKVIDAVGRTMTNGGLDAAIDTYLSAAHRDAETPLCPFAALGSEMARSSEEARIAAADVLNRLLTLLTPGADNDDPRSEAIVALSTMVGAMTLARIVPDKVLSAEIIDRTKDHLRRH
ncbi:MAG TPA: TetR family transcriptional regulator [Rhodopila sp.]|jgi:TetR/AcrR family transcriptional repressor of nem operon